jgi:nucleotide-binding universal stress UspA family protein
MIEIKRIVAVVDLSSRSVKIIEWGKTLATLANAELVLYYDMSGIEAMKDYANLFAFPIRPDVSEEAKEKARKAFENELRDFEGSYRIEYACCDVDGLKRVVEAEQPELTILPDELYSLAHKLTTEALIIK